MLKKPIYGAKLLGLHKNEVDSLKSGLASIAGDFAANTNVPLEQKMKAAGAVMRTFGNGARGLAAKLTGLPPNDPTFAKMMKGLKSVKGIDEASQDLNQIRRFLTPPQQAVKAEPSQLGAIAKTVPSQEQKEATSERKKVEVGSEASAYSQCPASQPAQTPLVPREAESKGSEASPSKTSEQHEPGRLPEQVVASLPTSQSRHEGLQLKPRAKSGSLKQSEVAEICTKVLDTAFGFQPNTGKWLFNPRNFTRQCGVSEDLVKGLSLGSVENVEYAGLEKNYSYRPADEGQLRLIVGHIIRHVRGGYDDSFLRGVMSLMRDSLRAPRMEDRHLIPFRNGVLTYRQQPLSKNPANSTQTNNHEAQRDEGLHTQPHSWIFEPAETTNKNVDWSIDADWVSGTDCDLFKRFLHTSTGGDHRKQNVLKAWMLAVLFGWHDLHRFLHLKGFGGTGKGTYIRLCEVLAGGSVHSTTISRLDDRFQAAELYRKRLVVIPDADDTVKSAATFKSATGGDKLAGELKGVSGTPSFTFKGVFIVASNGELEFKDQSSGINRRRLRVEFDTVISAEEKARYDRDLSEIIIESELPQLVNLLLEMDQNEARELLKASTKETLQGNLNSNPTMRWMNEYLRRCSPGEETLQGPAIKAGMGSAEKRQHVGKKLYATYQQWCFDQDLTPLSQVKFGDTLIDLACSNGVATKKLPRTAAGVRYANIALVPDGTGNLFTEGQS